MLIVLFLLESFRVSCAQAELWNKVIATFDDEVLTYWEVKREMAVQYMKEGPAISHSFSQDQFKEMTKKIIIERLVFREAHSFGVSSLSQKEKDGLFQKFQNKFNTAFEFKKFMSDDQWSEEELKEILSRSIVVERFIKEKILSAYIYVSDEDVKEFQKKSQSPLSLKQAKAELIKIKLQENLKDWIENIKRRSHVKIVWD